MLHYTSRTLRAFFGIACFALLSPLVSNASALSTDELDCVVTCPQDMELNCNSSTDPDVTGYPSITCSIDCGGCTLTYGYWKTHSEYGPAPYDETWANLENGADTEFFGTGQSYHEILWTPPSGGNAYLILAHQWIAAQMNQFAGASIPSDVLDSFNSGSTLLELYQDEVHIPNGTADRTWAIELAGHLDGYNNGIVGPGHCGDGNGDSDCDETIADAEWSYSDSSSGDCPVVIVRTWTATVGDQTFSCIQHLTIYDDEAPVLIGVPADVQVECGADIPVAAEVSSEDACDANSTVSLAESTEYLDCGFIITRTWTASDACGNETSDSQLITVVDTTLPFVIDSVPAVVTLECDDEGDLPSPVFGDDCDDDLMVELTVDVLFDNGCESDIQLTWVATDDCGNQVSVSQLVHIVDTTPPVINDLPSNMILNCGDQLPAPPTLTATDNCDENVEIMFEEVFGDDVESGCQLVQPISAFYNPDWAVWLQNVPVAYQYYTVSSGQFVEMEDGTAHIIATVVSTSNANAGWLVDVWLTAGMDWETWQAQDWPNSYKDDFNVAGDNYLDWTYFLINNDAASLTGWGDFEGSVLNVLHAPSSNYYGYQLGVASNNVNLGYGSGGWFTYEGWILDASNGTEIYADGFGDFAFMHECCDTPPVTWTWTAEDCAGNIASHSISISFSGGEIPPSALGADNNAEPCLGDFNHNLIIDTADLLVMLSEYGCVQGCAFDLDSNGKTDTADLLVLLSVLGQTCQ